MTDGTSDTTFAPGTICTRAHGVTFLSRAAKANTASGNSNFADVDANAYYASAVKWAVDNGITNGISSSLFGPDSSCTRAQIVTFLYRMYQGK
ncbi:S-layer homology domain-containing protein [Butyricicoccus sp. AF24-19AC]|nr:S-layer homology domain-containing protein [Butyricicoccus sp. AF24-19AC]